MKKASCIACILLSGTCIAGVTNDDVSASTPINTWTEIAPGVYEMVDNKGSTYQKAFGEAGAKHDLTRLKNDLDEIKNKESSNFTAIRNLNEAINNLEKRKSNFQDLHPNTQGSTMSPARASPQSSTTATGNIVGYVNSTSPSQACGFLAHQISDVYGSGPGSVGGGSGFAASSITYLAQGDGSNHTAHFYVQATVYEGTTPYTNSNSTYKSVSGYNQTIPVMNLSTTSENPFADLWQIHGKTFSYMSVSGCSGGYQSFSKDVTLY